MQLRSNGAVVHALRPRLVPTSESFSDRDLAVSGYILVAEGRGHDSPTRAVNRSITWSRS